MSKHKHLVVLLIGVLFSSFVTDHASGVLIVRQDDFSTNTRSDYTDLSMYFTPTRAASDWTVSGGVLNVIGGDNGMLAIEDSVGAILPTPDHFSISFSFTPTPIDSQDHPGIVFDRNGTNSRILYLRTHSNQAVAATGTSPSGISFGSTLGMTGLAVGTAYDLLFDVDYITQVAQVSVFPFGGGALIDSATISGASFVSDFGANTGGAFGLVGFSSEGAQIDNLLVIDFTKSPPVPEPSSLTLAAIGLLALMKRRRR